MTWAPRRCPSLAFRHGSGAMLDVRILDLIATVVERCEGPGEPGPGHPPAETVRVLAALRRFLAAIPTATLTPRRYRAARCGPSIGKRGQHGGHHAGTRQRSRPRR